MGALNFHLVAEMSVERLLNGVAEGMVIAFFAWLLLRVIGRRNSGTRFAVWFCALLAIALAPFVESSGHVVVHPTAAVTMPRAWSLYLFAAWATIASIGLARVVAGFWHLRSIRHSCRAVEGSALAVSAAKAAASNEARTASLKRCPDTSVEAAPIQHSVLDNDSAVDIEAPAISDGVPATEAANINDGVLHRKAALRMVALDPALMRSLTQSGRSIELCVSEELQVPTAIGLVKPAIVIPAWALRELSPAELNAVVLHELAHLRRWDDWTNLAQKVLRALFFFHPAVWWVENRLSLEREMACDDMVLAQTANPRAYAKCLVSLAEKNLLRRGIALAQAAVGRMRHTSLRILQILDARRSNSARIWKPAPWVIAGFSVACLATAAHAPRLVAFGDSADTRPNVSMSASSRVSSSPTASSYGDSSFMTPVVLASYVAGTSGSEVKHGKKAAAEHPASSASRREIEKPTWLHAQNAEFKSNRAAPAAIQAVHRDTVQQPGAIPLLRTSSAREYPVVMMQQAVLLMMQDQSTGEVVPVLWRVNVWQLVVLPQAPQKISAEISSKSI